MDPKLFVTAGYDRIADEYAAWSRRIADPNRLAHTELLLRELATGERVVDLGCGNGLPVARMLAERFQVTGVDASARQIELARQNVPKATLIHADMTLVDFAPASVGGVAAFFSLFHVPREEHAQMFAKIARWLRPGGWLVASLGTQSEPGDLHSFLGTGMYWSQFPAEDILKLVRAAGLEIVTADERTVDEDGVPVTFLWRAARKPRMAKRAPTVGIES